MSSVMKGKSFWWLKFIDFNNSSWRLVDTAARMGWCCKRVIFCYCRCTLLAASLDWELWLQIGRDPLGRKRTIIRKTNNAWSFLQTPPGRRSILSILSSHFQLPFYWAFILDKSFFSLKIRTFTKVITNSDNSMNVSNLTTHQTQTNCCS